MKKIFTKAALYLILFIILSCRSNSIKKEYNQLKSSTITIPKEVDVYKQGEEKLDFLDNDKCMKLITYVDYKRCSSCVVRKLTDWNEIVAYTYKFNGQLKLYIVLSPSETELNSVILSLKSSSFHYPVIIDKLNEFKKLNPSISDNRLLHTFLLDKNNKVLMIGDPRNSNKLYSLFKKTVENNINENRL